MSAVSSSLPHASTGAALFCVDEMSVIKVELRSEVDKRLVDVIDGVVNARRGSIRTEVLSEILEEWAARKVHEAKIVLRCAGNYPETPEGCRK